MAVARCTRIEVPGRSLGLLKGSMAGSMRTADHSGRGRWSPERERRFDLRCARPQALAALLHQRARLGDVIPDELAVAFRYVAADDHCLDVGRPGSEHHHRDLITEPVEVWRPHVDDRDVGLFARGEGAGLMFEVPDRAPSIVARRSMSR